MKIMLLGLLLCIGVAPCWAEEYIVPSDEPESGAESESEAEEAYRTFIIKGQEIKAKIIAVEPAQGNVVIELDNQQRKKVKASIFSEADQTYIRERALIQEFLSHRLRIQMKKNVVNRKRENPHHGIQRDVDVIRYDIVVSNGSSLDFGRLLVAYNLFYEQDVLATGRNDVQKHCLTGAFYLDPMPSRGKQQVHTKTYEVYKQKLVKGYTTGGPTNQSGKSKGAWIKVLLKTPSGMTAVREVCIPKNANEVFTWRRPR